MLEEFTDQIINKKSVVISLDGKKYTNIEDINFLPQLNSSQTNTKINLFKSKFSPSTCRSFKKAPGRD